MGVSLVSNPPYNMKWTPPMLAGFMSQYMGWAMAPKNNANYAFVQTGLSFADSKAVFLLPNGCLTADSKEEKMIRQQIVSSNILSAVVCLPDSMFESTSIPVCLLVFDMNKTTQRVEMVDMRQCYEVEIRDQKGQVGGDSHLKRTYHKEVKVISEAEMQRAIDAIEGALNIAGYCVSVLPETIKENDYNFSPGRYIEQEPIEEHHRPFGDIAADYNRIIAQKNSIQIRMNKTASKRLGFDCLDSNKPDIGKAFSVVGENAEKENYISFTASDGISISCSTKDGIPDLIVMFLNYWKRAIMNLNNEENRILAEFRDALLPGLMSGEITIKEEDHAETH